MKKILETIIGLVCIFSLFLAGAQNPDGSMNVWWTISCLAIAVVCGFIWTKLQLKPIHITDEAYEDLQSGIRVEAEMMDPNQHKTVQVDTCLPDDAAITLTVEITTHTSKSKFTDDLWGYTQTFTETNWSCKCEVLKAVVTDSKDLVLDSDFDEDRLELEFESTQWS